jgi:CBS domain-containing protein
MPPAPPRHPDLAALTGPVDAATDDDALRAALTHAAGSLVRSPRSSAAAELWSAVLRHGVAAGTRLVAGASPPHWVWLTSGSAARGEAVPGSDVETLVVLDDDVSDADKADALGRAAEVHALLERCGIAGDANGVLASRARFCRRARSWLEGVDHWAAAPHRDRGVVMTGVLADAAALPGQAGAPELITHVRDAAQEHYSLRQAMLQDATAVRATVPSRLRTLTRHHDTVDIKPAVLDPIVKIARWGALSVGSRALATRDRLDDAQAAQLFGADDATSLRDCHAWLLEFRWRTRAAAWRADRRPGDVVVLGELAPQDRAMLRSIGREVAGIGRTLDYLASTSAFR